jgi:methionine synthase II (cobalamin-independent)
LTCWQLEYDSERAGSFEPIRHLPRNKRLVLGLVSTKTAEMEDVDHLVKRVHQAADMLVNGVEKRTKEEALNQCVEGACLTRG